MEWFWPIRTGITFFDVWFIVHLSFWVFVGSNIWAIKANRFKSLMWCLVLALLWEVFEKFAEKKWPNLWLNPESFVNSWISDPLTVLIGVLGICYLLDRKK